jgi:hypothetical protein
MAKDCYSKKSILTGISSFLAVLFAMPLGHALMIVMEHLLSQPALHYSAFAMGAVGLAMTIAGVFAKGDTRQTLWGLFGGLLFWTGWVEFIYVYYAHRYGVQPLLDASGAVATKPEYLIMPSSFGFWVMFMLLYIFCIKSGCNFFNYLQKVFFRKSSVRVKIYPMIRHTAIVTFMELNLILWTNYLLLLFCYDDHFIGDRSPVTAIVAFGCLAGSVFMFKRLLKISRWGYAIRYSIATVVVFWTFIEVLGRWDFFSEIWVKPMEYKTEMIMMLIVFLLLTGFLLYRSSEKKATQEKITKQKSDNKP